MGVVNARRNEVVHFGSHQFKTSHDNEETDPLPQALQGSSSSLKQDSVAPRGSLVLGHVWLEVCCPAAHFCQKASVAGPPCDQNPNGQL